MPDEACTMLEKSACVDRGYPVSLFLAFIVHLVLIMYPANAPEVL